MQLRSFVFALALAVPFAACAGAPRPAEAAYTLVYLKTGARTGLSKEEQGKVFSGHFANMERMARGGQLVLAGPFGEHRTDPALRGIFLLTTAERAMARQYAETDPGFQAGVFALEYHELVTDAALREFVAFDLAETDAAKAAGRTPKPGEYGRGFVLLIADDFEAATAALAETSALVLSGRYDDRGLFAILDATDLTAAEAALATVRPRLGAHRLEEWFASRNLLRLRKR